MSVKHSIRFIRTFILAAIGFAVPAVSFAQISVGVGVAVRVAPPELPVYEQPLCPGEGYIWTPGYWAYGDDDYYWVPGTWVLAPRVGVLWTPGYWGWGDGGYIWHVGYWGPHVGFYGGVNYGFGYVGVGYLGGRWDHGHFAYNRAVNNVNITVIHNTYNTRISNRYRTSTRVSYNGGTGGIRARETARDRQIEREHHIEKTSVQVQHQQEARKDRSQFASVNHGRPNVAATPRPGAFNDRGAVHASEAPAARRNDRPANSVKPNGGGGHADRPNTASRSNTPRSSNSDRPNSAANSKASRTSSDRPANAHTAKPRSTPAESSKTSRTNSDRPANAHTANPRSTPAESSKTSRTSSSHVNSSERPAQHGSARPAEKPTERANTKSNQSHSNASKPAEKTAPAHTSHESAPQQHSAPHTESKSKEPHGKP
jgi:hypothetical protein